MAAGPAERIPSDGAAYALIGGRAEHRQRQGRPYPPPASPEPVWPAQLTVLAAIVLQLTLPQRLTVGPTWLLPVLEGLLVIGLFCASPRKLEYEHPRRKTPRSC